MKTIFTSFTKDYGGSKAKERNKCMDTRVGEDMDDAENDEWLPACEKYYGLPWLRVSVAPPLYRYEPALLPHGEES